jgi:hypothetical protein
LAKAQCKKGSAYRVDDSLQGEVRDLGRLLVLGGDIAVGEGGVLLLLLARLRSKQPHKPIKQSTVSQLVAIGLAFEHCKRAFEQDPTAPPTALGVQAAKLQRVFAHEAILVRRSTPEHLLLTSTASRRSLVSSFPSISAAALVWSGDAGCLQRKGRRLPAVGNCDVAA